MRIDREHLLNIATEFVAERTANDYHILAVYLCGTLLGENYLLGGSSDIDLVFIHLVDSPKKREIIRLTDEVHLDVAHHSQDEYTRPYQLRTHPWLGWTLFDCKHLFDPRHFLDYTQAGVRGQFHRPDHVMARARPQYEHARQIWLELNTALTDSSPKGLQAYLKAVGHAANALALLSGPPLTERRFLLDFPQRAQAINRPGLYPGLLGLLGAPSVEGSEMRAWLPHWLQAIESLSRPEELIRLHPDRRLYYLRALETLLDTEEPHTILWPLLHTWTQAVQTLPTVSTQRAPWQEAGEQLGLLGKPFLERLAALDAYLDLVEDTLTTWARESGA